MVSSVSFAQGSGAQIRSLETLLKKKPNDRFLNLKLGDIYFKSKNYDKALSFYKIANKTTNVQALEGIANCLTEKKDYLELIRALEILKQENPNIPKYIVRLADAYIIQGDTNKAIENYRAAIKIAPKYSNAYDGLIGLHESQKNYYEAAIVVKDAISAMGDPKVLYASRLCKYKFLENYYEDAKIVCQDATARSNQIADNHIYLGLSHRNTGNEEQARKIILSAAKKFKRSELAQFYGGQISDESRNWEQSITFYRQGTRVDSSSSRCFLGLAKAQYELKKYEASWAAFMKACELDNTVDNEMKKYAGFLRSKNENAWYTKMKNDVDKCPVLRDSREVKKTSK